MEVPERHILWSSEDAIADEHERAAMLLEARCKEAVIRTEQETRRLIDELDDMCTMAGKIMPEMNCDVEEGNWKALEATGSGRREVVVFCPIDVLLGVVVD